MKLELYNYVILCIFVKSIKQIYILLCSNNSSIYNVCSIYLTSVSPGLLEPKQV
jgi:hypothetical protein